MHTRTRWAAALAAITLVAVAAAWSTSSRGGEAQELPQPSAGALLTDGLIQPKNMKIGPDGLLYIAESGSGGDTIVNVPGVGETGVGSTGRVSSIDPDTGARTTLLDALPSSLGPVEDAVGPADVAFIGDQLYYLQTHGGEEWGFPDTPTGIYEINNGVATLVADIGAFNAANPTQAITDGTQPDVEPGGNPYSMIVRDGVFYVVDGNHNRLIRATVDGDVSEVVEFPGHPVSTGIAQGETGPFTIAYLGPGPFLPEAGKVVTVGAGGGAITEIASGASMLTDVEFGPGGQLYALQFNDTVEAGEQVFAPGTGKIMTVNGDGTLSPLVVGLTFTTGMYFDGDTAFVVNDGLNATGTGQVWRIDNFSSVTPPPAPTPAPATATAVAPVATPTSSGIVAPDTGTGPADGGMAAGAWLLVALLAGAALTTGGLALARARR